MSMTTQIKTNKGPQKEEYVPPAMLKIAASESDVAVAIAVAAVWVIGIGIAWVWY